MLETHLRIFILVKSASKWRYEKEDNEQVRYENEFNSAMSTTIGETLEWQQRCLDSLLNKLVDANFRPHRLDFPYLNLYLYLRGIQSS
jgi:hypothetical protein